MKELPILFSGPMVRSTLDGRKTQTRRVVKPCRDRSYGCPLGCAELAAEINRCDYINSVFGKPGDSLWVRETFVAFGRWETRYSEKKGRDEWHFVDMTLDTGREYRFDGALPNARRGGVTPAWWRRPAIFMPRPAARALLSINDVRVERLQDISEADAIAEGAYLFPAEGGGYKCERGEQEYDTAVEAYRYLWDNLNAVRGHGWATNPYVWVVEFERMKS